MTDTTNTQSPVDETITAPVKPEGWAQHIWESLEEGEQWLVQDLHDMGYVFSHDIWPTLKSTLGLLFSQLGMAALSAIVANIADPALIPAAVGSALVVTASTTGVVDAKAAIANAQTAMDADPTVQAILKAGQ